MERLCDSRPGGLSSRTLVTTADREMSPIKQNIRIRLYYNCWVADEPLDLDLLDEEDPFEIDAQAAHLFKHPRLGIEDIRDVWASDPMFYPAKPPAHWLMVAEVDGTVLIVPLAPARDGNPRRCRPIGCYQASKQLADQYRRDR
jgi:hypothetical protein